MSRMLVEKFIGSFSLLISLLWEIGVIISLGYVLQDCFLFWRNVSDSDTEWLCVCDSGGVKHAERFKIARVRGKNETEFAYLLFIIDTYCFTTVPAAVYWQKACVIGAQGCCILFFLLFFQLLLNKLMDTVLDIHLLCQLAFPLEDHNIIPFSLP